MKKFSLLMVLVLILSLTSIHATDKVIITVASPEPLDEAFSKLLPQFHKNHTNIRLNLLPPPCFGSYNNWLSTAVVLNEEFPDVVVVDMAYVAQYISRDAFEDLNQPPYRAWKMNQKMAPHKMAQVTDEEGHLIAFPLDIEPGCAYWRRDRFAEAGVDIGQIKTMGDLFDAAGKLTRDIDGDGKTDQWLTSDATQIAQMILRSSPNHLMVQEKSHFVWDTEQIREAFTWAQKFKQAGYCAGIGAWTVEWYKAFQNGTVAYEISGSWLGWNLQNWMAPKTAEKWGVSWCPSLKTGGQPLTGSWGGSFLAIPKKTQHKKEAWEFIRFACLNKYSQLTIFQTEDTLPAYMPVWRDPVFDEKLDFFAGQPARRLWIDIAKKIPPVPISKYDHIVNAMIYQELKSVLVDDKDIDKAIEDLKKLTEERIVRQYKNP